MNDKALDFFKNIATSSELAPESIKLTKRNDFSDLDAAFIRRYAGAESTVLDIGSGTGLIVNKFYSYVKSITAIEPFAEFTKFIIKSDNINVVHSDLFEFNTTERFDVITIFGVLHYFDAKQAAAVYEKYVPLLEPGGIIIVKNQFGVHEDVTIDGFSEELGKDYYAQYRKTDTEIAMLKRVGIKSVEVVDIYPPEYNRWDNTHFYALVGRMD